MSPGVINLDLTKTDTIRKTALIDRELDILQVDIAALQETRLADSGSLKERHYTFFWQGHPEHHARIHGVGFAVRNNLVSAITTPIGLSERIITLKISTKSGFAHIISAYAPTLTSTLEEKDKFYESFQRAIESVPANEQLFILGDFNARVGADNTAWPTCLGHHGTGKINENGERLLEFCCHNALCISNTYFALKEQYKVTWRHPRSGHWHQLDHVLVRRSNLNTIKITRSFHSADCNTDHALVISKVKIVLRKLHRSRVAPKPRISTTAIKDLKSKAAFIEEFRSRQSSSVTEMSTDDKWNALRTNIYESAVKVFGQNRATKKDWIEENAETLLPLVDKKKKARMEFNKTSSQKSLDQLRKARADVQRESRRCANQYWIDLCSSIQTAHDTGDVRTMYQKMKLALGPTISRSAPLKSSTGEMITSKSDQLKRWVEHYSQLYALERDVPPAFEDLIPRLPIMTELDREPTVMELEKAIDQLAAGKAPGNDGIPGEILKELKDSLLLPLYDLLLQCWRSGDVPQELRNAKIVTLYKNKGDKGDCNNYRGISLLSITGKVFARVILKRLQTIAERVLPESQCGFRAGRSTMDMIFSLRQLQEKSREQGKPLFVCFVDLTKAFDTVSRSGLYSVLRRIGCPPTLLKLIISFHSEMTATVQFDGSTSEEFPIKCGVKQGCVLAPTLFGIYFSALLDYAFRDCPGDVYLNTRSDGSLFNLARLRAKTKTVKTILRDFLFADDAALVAHNEETLQHFMDKLSAACNIFRMQISVKKTVVLAQNTDTAPNIQLNGNSLDVVSKFNYLGSTVTSSTAFDEEVSSRIGRAATVFGKLTSRAWNNKKLTTRTKILIYQACVLSTLLYGAETWTTYAKHEKRLNAFHLRCLRKILNIKWQDKVPNTEVLSQAGIPSLVSLIAKRRLRWLGHVQRMNHHRLPRQILFGELANGTRSRGRPKLRFKDICKSSMKRFGINHTIWEESSSNRIMWRQQLHVGARNFEQDYIKRLQEKRQHRKERSIPPTKTRLSCSHCGRLFTANIGRISHERRCARNP